jgi:hypothetical protein
MKKDQSMNTLKKLYHILAIVLLIGLFSPCFAFGETSLTLDTFWQLRLELKQLYISEINAKLALLNQYPSDHETFNAKEQGITAEYENKLQEIYNTYGITDRDYTSFASSRKKEINNYLNQNPQLKQRVEDADKEMMNVINQFENLLITSGTRGN